MPKRATPIVLSEKEQEGLLQITKRHRSEQQVVVYFTPKHASWMNQVETWLSIWYVSCSNGAIFLLCPWFDLRGKSNALQRDALLVR